MIFNIESYLNSLPDNIKSIDVSEHNLQYLPCLSRFKNLEILYCGRNNLTSLPPLPDNLKKLFCNANKLTSLPVLNKKLKVLYCNNNQLTSLPLFNEKLRYFDCNGNPISEIIYINNISIIKKQIQILNNFRYLYYSLKYKKQFKYLLWVKIREPKAMQRYHPSYLIENLQEDTDLDVFLDNWS